MKINYTYSKYKDFPEATEISESRARNQVLFSMMCFCGLILSAIMLVLCESVIDWISGIVSVLLFAALLIYLYKYYPVVTERKIQKAIANRIKLEEEVATSKYKCYSIELHNKFSSGTCNVCFEKDKPLTFCTIKKDIGTRKIFICEDCIRQFKGIDPPAQNNLR